MKYQVKKNGISDKSHFPDVECLEGWKSIAVYLNRTVRTVQRWEKTEGLPTYRQKHNKTGSVYAFKTELDTWRQENQLSLNQPKVEISQNQSEGYNENATSESSISHPYISKKALLVALIICLSITSFALYFTLKQNQPLTTSGKIRLAILPFKNLNVEGDQDWLADGLTEEMITKMGQIQTDKFGVIGHTTIATYKGTSKNLSEIGRELNVEYVLEGSLRRESNQIRISVKLIDVKTQLQVWAESYDRDMQKILHFQDEAATNITRALASSLISTTRNQPTTNNSEASEAYLKGRYLWHKNIPESLGKSIVLFETAVRLDPDFAQGWAALANSHAKMGVLSMRAPKDCFPQAREAANRALQLNPSLAEAHAVEALVKLYWDWDWSGAEKSFLRANELNPSLATNHQNYAFYLTAMGRHDEAITTIHRAVELEPLSAAINDKVGWFYYISRRYDEAIFYNLKALELEPNSTAAQNNLRMAYLRKGMIEEARAAEIKFLQMTGMEKIAEKLNTSNPKTALLNFSRMKLKLLDTNQTDNYVSSSYRISLYAELNESERLYQSLGKALKEHDSIIPLLKVHPMFDDFRNDPFYVELIQQLKL